MSVASCAIAAENGYCSRRAIVRLPTTSFRLPRKCELAIHTRTPTHNTHTVTGALAPTFVPAPSTQGGRGIRSSEAASVPFIEIPLGPYLRNGGKRKVEITLMFARLVEICLSPLSLAPPPPAPLFSRGCFARIIGRNTLGWKMKMSARERTESGWRGDENSGCHCAMATCMYTSGTALANSVRLN